MIRGYRLGFNWHCLLKLRRLHAQILEYFPNKKVLVANILINTISDMLQQVISKLCLKINKNKLLNGEFFYFLFGYKMRITNMSKKGKGTCLACIWKHKHTYTYIYIYIWKMLRKQEKKNQKMLAGWRIRETMGKGVKGLVPRIWVDGQ